MWDRFRQLLGAEEMDALLRTAKENAWGLYDAEAPQAKETPPWGEKNKALLLRFPPASASRLDR